MTPSLLQEKQMCLWEERKRGKKRRKGEEQRKGGGRRGGRQGEGEEIDIYIYLERDEGLMFTCVIPGG